MSRTATIVEQVQLLHELATPAADIARRLRLDQATVLHVIQHGESPARQQTMQFSEPK